MTATELDSLFCNIFQLRKAVLKRLSEITELYPFHPVLGRDPNHPTCECGKSLFSAINSIAKLVRCSILLYGIISVSPNYFGLEELNPHQAHFNPKELSRRGIP